MDGGGSWVGRLNSWDLILHRDLWTTHRRLLRQEIGYVSLDAHGAELLFQIITAREERASIACASNAPFSEWGKTFTDARLAAAVVDRLTFNAHIINTGTNSYRLRTTRTSRKGAATRPT